MAGINPDRSLVPRVFVLSGELERDNSQLFSIAILLQVTSLILVPARDLRRH